MEESKADNPKAVFGAAKVSMAVLPAQVLSEVSIGMLEGAKKYARHNFRVVGRIDASTYYDAALRHMIAWWEGQDIDKDSGLSHVTKAICSLFTLRDAMLHGTFYDDRPPGMVDPDWMAEHNKLVAAMAEKYPNPKKPFTRMTHGNPVSREPVPDISLDVLAPPPVAEPSVRKARGRPVGLLSGDGVERRINKPSDRRSYPSHLPINCIERREDKPQRRR